MKIIAVSVCAFFCALVLKEKNREFAVIISIFASALIFFSVLSEMKSLFDYLVSLSSYSQTIAVYTKLMIKILSITLLTQIVCDICRDNGENALASATTLGAKIIVVSLILPLFETVIKIIGGLVK